MKFAVYDACFSDRRQNMMGVSGKYVLWEMQRHKEKPYPIAQADIILASCQSVSAAHSLSVLKKRYPDKLIIAGGPASTSPYSLGKVADVVCVGDGQSFLNVLFTRSVNEAKELPNAWVDGQTRHVEIDQNFPWEMPPIQGEDDAYRIWCGRGCKNKCSFCQVGWAYKYKENPQPSKVINTAIRLKNKKNKINYVSNDIAQHSFYHKLPSTEHGSYTFKYLKKHGLPPARQIRLGVEGVSEALRKKVKKPISYDDLLGCTIWLNRNKKSVRWFMIAGLPGETSTDWLELKTIIMNWKLKTVKGVLALSFTAFCPDPATPLATAKITDDYYENWLDFKEWFFGGVGWSNRIKLMQPQSPDSRIKKAMLSLGLSEKQLREGGHVSPNARLLYPYR